MIEKKLRLELSQAAYEIDIGAGLLSQPACFKNQIKTRQIAIVSQQKIADYYLSTLMATLRKIDAELHIEIILIGDGESYKNQETLEQIYDRLIAQKFSRDALLIALGGGVVGDMTGFAAATYQRGIDFMQIPTTLLAQVDAAVGGKTAINHPLGKNLIGAFYQPKHVVIDTQVLKTLAPCEMASGLAEVIKYGLIKDKNLLNQLADNRDLVKSLEQKLLTEIIYLSCKHKADIVSIDERENGNRALLNLGHTFGHALESLTAYQQYKHGEAVAIGTMMALELSAQLGYLQRQEVAFAEQLFQNAHCPVFFSAKEQSITPYAIYQAMWHDKKVRAGKLNLIILKALGQACICQDIPEERILSAIEKRFKTL